MAKSNSASAASKVSEPVAQAASSLPLFFKSPAPLDAKRHAKAGLSRMQDMSFASATNSIMINAIEIGEAAKLYPIVFTNDKNVMPAAVLGLEQQNYFVDAENRWKDGAYIPAYVRKYPFVFMDVPARNQFMLCIDEGAAQYRERGDKDSTPLYDADKPSELSRNALEFCSAFQNHYQITQAFCEALKDADLLKPTRSDIKLFNGREIHLTGFQVLDEAKFNALPDKTLLDFRKKGWLPLLYFTLLSASNWKTLINMAAAREQA